MINKMIADTDTLMLNVDYGKSISSVSLIFCNLDDSSDVYLDLFLVQQDKDIQTNPETQIVKNFKIPPTDTMIWSTERFIMTAGYKLYQRQSVDNKVTCNLSYLEL